MHCEKCNKEITRAIGGICDDCWICDDCGNKENLVSYSNGIFCHSCHKKKIDIRIANFNGNTKYTQEIICPYCGYKFSDSWEIKDDSGDYDCPDCNYNFNYERIVTVEYSTYKYH